MATLSGSYQQYSRLRNSLEAQPTYESIDNTSYRSQQQFNRLPSRGKQASYSDTFNGVSCRSEGGFLDEEYWKSNTKLLRNTPIVLPDGTTTIVQHAYGNYATAAIILFIIVFPFGLCALPILPFLLFNKWSKWMKDTRHIDPISNHLVGVYRRGKLDGPQNISFYREPNNPQRDEDHEQDEEEESFDNQSYRENRRGNRQSRSQPSRNVLSPRRASRSRTSRRSQVTIHNEPVKLQIIFNDNPVELPDGERTITYKRIGMGNLVCAYVTYFLGCICFPFPLLCFLMPCLKDVEHIHPQTKEIIGIHYKCV